MINTGLAMSKMMQKILLKTQLVFAGTLKLNEIQSRTAIALWCIFAEVFKKNLV